MSAAVRLGTRRSPLALAQARQVATAIQARTGTEPELVLITSEGDVNPGPLEQIGGTGVFVGALRVALLERRIDLAVHSLKDLPTAPAPGLTVAAVCERSDPRDVLCARDGLTLTSLPSGSTIGTGSPRRVGQLRALGLGLEVVDVRGNVGTRLALVESGRLDAVVLARAGLVRLGRLDAVSEVIDPIQMLPAPGQGALAVECRDLDVDMLGLLGELDHLDTRTAVTAERALLAALEAGCTSPVGALAEVSEGGIGEEAEIYLRGVVAASDGSSMVRLSATGPVSDPVGLGRRLARLLIEAGAPNLSAPQSPSLPAPLPANNTGRRSRLSQEENVS